MTNYEKLAKTSAKLHANYQAGMDDFEGFPVTKYDPDLKQIVFDPVKLKRFDNLVTKLSGANVPFWVKSEWSEEDSEEERLLLVTISAVNMSADSGFGPGRTLVAYNAGAASVVFGILAAQLFRAFFNLGLPWTIACGILFTVIFFYYVFKPSWIKFNRFK